MDTRHTPGPSKDTSLPPAFSSPLLWRDASAKKSRGLRGPSTDTLVTFRNTRKHARDGVETRTTRGASLTKKMNRIVGFVYSSVPAIAVAPFGSLPAILANCAFEPCPHASPSQTRLHSARKLQLRTQALPTTTSRFQRLQCQVRVHARPGHNVAAAAWPTKVHRNLESEPESRASPFQEHLTRCVGCTLRPEGCQFGEKRQIDDKIR